MILFVHYFELNRKSKRVFWSIALATGVPSLLLLALYLLQTIDLFDNGVTAGVFIACAGTAVFSLVTLFKSTLYNYMKATEYRGHLISYPIAILELTSIIAAPAGIIIAVISAFGG